MNIKKVFSLMIGAAVCMSVMAVSAFAENDDVSEPADDELIVAEEVPIADGIRRGEGYYECHVIYYYDMNEVRGADGEVYALVGSIGGNLKEGETRETIENEMTESVRAGFVSMGVDPDDYPFYVYTYFYDDYDSTPEDFLRFISADVSERRSNWGLTEEAEVSVGDEIHRGEGYYECRISFHGGEPRIYDENGVEYDLGGIDSGYLKEGETRENVENETIENMKGQFVSIGVNPDDYPFDVYTYFYDDYEFAFEEFLDFISDDIARREWEREHGDDNAEVPNPPMGTALPYGAAALAVLSGICLAAANKKSI